MAMEHGRIYKERRHLPLWLWIVPLLLLFTFLGIFFLRQHAMAAHAAFMSPPENMLPELGVVQFDAGRATLTEDGQATLERAAEAMHGNPNVRLRLEGDAQAAKKVHRAGLWNQRMTEVVLYLEAHGIDRARLTVGGIAPSKVAMLEPGPDSRRVELYTR